MAEKLEFVYTATDNTKAATKSVISGLTSIAKIGATVAVAAITAVGVGLTVMGAKALQAGSDVAEMRSKFAVVFGDLASSVVASLEDIAEATGASNFQLQGMAAELGDTFKPMGFATDAAAAMAVQVSALAIDLASFNNITVDESMMRLQGGLIGNHENLIKFGVLINEASLKEELLRMGSQDLTGAMLNQAKVQARLNIIMRGTTDAQGDAERTAGGWANMMRSLQGRIQDLVAEIGLRLLPVFEPLLRQFLLFSTVVSVPIIGFFEDFAAVLTRISNLDSMGQLKNALLDLGSAVFDVLPSLSGWQDAIVSGFSTILTNIVIPAIRGFTNFFKNVWPSISTILQNWGVLAGDILTAVAFVFVNVLIPAVMKFATIYLALQAKISDFWIEKWTQMKVILAQFWAFVQPILMDFLAGVKVAFDGFMESVGGIEGITAIIQNTFGTLKASFFETKEAIIDFVMNGIELVRERLGGFQPTLQSFSDVWNEIWPILAATALTAWEVITGAMIAAQQVFVATILPIWSETITILTETLASFGLNWSDVWRALGEATIIVILGIVAVIAGLIGVFVAAVAAISSALNVLLESVDTIFINIVGVFAGLRVFIEGFVLFWDGIFNLNARQTIDSFMLMSKGVEQIVTAMVNLTRTIMKTQLDFVIVLVSTFVTTIISFFQNLKDVLVGNSIVPDMMEAIVESFSGMVDFVADLINGFVTEIINQFNSMKTSIITAMNSLRDQIVTIFNNIVNSIKSIFQNQDWASLGMGLVNRIIAGIQSGAGALRDMLRNLINDIISDVLGSFRPADFLSDAISGAAPGQSLRPEGISAVDNSRSQIINFNQTIIGGNPNPNQEFQLVESTAGGGFFSN